MARPSWLVDSNRIATKIRSASGASDPQQVNWGSNPTKTCPNCQHVIDNSDVTQEWPGLPRGVKFDPSDQEVIWHLLGKVGVENMKPHPFIEEFIPTVNEDDGICYTHPQNLPGVKQDGSVAHFFHRAIKAYNTGTRKRRKILSGSSGDVRWHKTGRTKPVHLDGIQKGCKKIMVLYLSPARGGKAEKTNWVMHQYHLGTEEDEREGEYVISKVFYQQQQFKQNEKAGAEVPEDDVMIVKVDPVTPMSVTPEPPRTERRFPDLDEVDAHAQESVLQAAQHRGVVCMEDDIAPAIEQPDCDDPAVAMDHAEKQDDKIDNDSGEKRELLDFESQYLLDSQQLVEALSLCDEVAPAIMGDEVAPAIMGDEVAPAIDQPDCDDLDAAVDHAEQQDDNSDNDAGEKREWWDSESQYLLNSQQLVEALSLCEEFLHSQSPNRDGGRNEQELRPKPRLADYARLGPEHLKKDLEECQDLGLDPVSLELDTPPDFRLSQIVPSQDSFIAWGGSKSSDIVDHGT